VGTRCADHVTPLYPQKLALTLPTGGGRSVGIVRLRTKATEFFFLVINECITAVKVSNFSGHYLRNRSTLDRGVLGYIGIL